MLAVLGMALGAGVASAEEQEESVEWPVQSLFLSDIAQVQKPGEVQTQAQLGFRDTGDDTLLEAPLEGEVGVARDFQLSAGVEWARESQAGRLERGLSEAEVGARFGLIDSAARGLALSTEATVVVARPELNDDQYTFLAGLRAFKRLGPLGLNAVIQPGLARPVEGSGLEPRANLGLGVSVGQGMLVPTGELRASFGGEEATEAVGGLKFKPVKSLELGLGALLGRREGQGVVGGVSTLLWELGGE